MKLAEIFVAVRPDTSNTGAELRRDLAKIDTGPAGDAVGKKFLGRFGRSTRGGAEREGKEVATRFGVGLNGAIGSVVSRSAGIFAAGFATLQAGSFLKGAIGSASDLGETMSKSSAVFGSSQKIIDRFAATSAEKLGQTKEQAVGAAAQFGNLFNQLGIGQKPAAEMSVQITQLASDFASFHNADVTEVLEAQTAAFRGEYDSIQRFVPTLNAAAVEQEGMRLKLAGSTKELTEQDKAVAVHSLMIRGAGKAQGDFAKTSDGMANQQRILSARFNDFKATIGQVALPLATRFFTFLNDRGIPVVQSVAGAVQRFAQSDGLRNFFETVRVKAQEFSGLVQTELVPRLQELGGFLAAEVVPRLREFASWVADSLVPKLRELAGFVKQNSDFFGPFATAVGVIVAGLKAFAIAQAAVNLVLSLNPIGAVVLTLAALVAGLVWAYRNSETFRKIVDGAFRVVQAAGKLMWEGFLKPALDDFAGALKWVWERAQEFGRTVVAGFNAIKEPARAALAWVVERMLGFVGSMIDAAAKAFGWVPGIGDNLKTAAAEFRKFKDSVNRELGNIKDQSLNFTIKYSDTGVNLTTPSSVGRRATGGPGGPVRAPGTGRKSDRAGLYALSDTEWVIQSDATREYGDSTMASVNAGTALIIPHAKPRGFAAGGRPGLGVNVKAPDPDGLSRSVAAAVAAMARPIAKALASSNGPLQRAMNFGRSQAGKPYGWGAVGPNAYDCSGFVSALVNVAQGRGPHSRLGATGSMPWSSFAPGSGRFMVGWFKGNPGHTAATINGVNFESRGGDGVVVGPRARGANSGLFTNRMKVRGFAGGGRPGEGRDGDMPFDLANPRGRDFLGRDVLKQLGIPVFDNGGRLMPGPNLVNNLTGGVENLANVDKPMELGPDTLRAMKRIWVEALREGRFELVRNNSGAYLLQMTNG